MKTVSAPLFCLGLATCIHCSSTYLAAQSSCGPTNVRYEVRTAPSRLLVPGHPSDRAQFFFIQETNGKAFGERPATITRIGIDGSWVGANHDGSGFSVLVAPGEHHLCANIQQARDRSEFTDLEAQPGQVYYFRTRQIPDLASGYLHLFFERVDIDEGQYLVAHSTPAESQPKR